MIDETAFPIVGAGFVFLVVLPVCALLAKLALALLESRAAGGPLRRLNARFVVLTAASAVPLAWFLSAGLHQLESSTSALACLFDHETAARCFEPAFFSLAIALTMAVLSAGVLRRHSPPRRAHTPAATALERRIARHVAGELRIYVTGEPAFTIGTFGLNKRTIVVGAAFASELTDEQLKSAIAHEAQHVAAHDPLRYLMLQLALAVNPVGRLLLQPHAAKWIAAREVQCDQAAVVGGVASPLSLAEAIVRAARPGPAPVVGLGSGGTSLIAFRIQMLLAFAETAPTRCCDDGPWAMRLSGLLVGVAMLLPHHLGALALDALHTGSESALRYMLP